MSLANALKAKGNAQEAYSAVLELGRIGNDKAVEMLITALGRADGVARSAARELGKLGKDRAIQPLVRALSEADLARAAADALLAFGSKAVGPLMDLLHSGNGVARETAASALGELRDPRSVDPLIHAMQTDDVYAVRTAAATALGNLKDGRAIWVLVQTLQLRDETTADRQAALAQLRQAAQLAMRKIGDPFAGKKAPDGKPPTPEAIAEIERALAQAEIHPRLAGNVRELNEAELVDVMKELISASEEISWASLESREPMLAPYFKTYEQRMQVAEAIGRELHRRGGNALVRRVHVDQLGNNTAIGNWWTGIL